MEGVFSALVVSDSDTDHNRGYNDTLAQIDGVLCFILFYILPVYFFNKRRIKHEEFI